MYNRLLGAKLLVSTNHLNEDSKTKLFDFICSDTMGNMGAFITITGKNLKPNYRSFEAVVS